MAGYLGRVSELARESNADSKCRLANARPEPVFKYRSNLIAACSVMNSIVTATSHGLKGAVDGL
jgi:hypothetical protein